jgi:hypothetical protein
MEAKRYSADAQVVAIAATLVRYGGEMLATAVKWRSRCTWSSTATYEAALVRAVEAGIVELGEQHTGAVVVMLTPAAAGVRWQDLERVPPGRS